MYAVRDARPYTVDVIDSNTWLPPREMSLPCCSKASYSNYLHTLHVSDDRILLCCREKDKLHVLSHSGELLQTHGRYWEEATDDDIVGQTASGEPVYGPVVRWGPRLCQVDDDGSALVADYVHDRLQVMEADGTWSVIELDQVVRHPKTAVWCNASLYVASEYVLARFS